MISNIESIARYNRYTLVSPEGGDDLDVDDCDFDFLRKDDDTFSINTLRSNLSLPTLEEQESIQIILEAIPEGLFATSTRGLQEAGSLDLRTRPKVVISPVLNKPLPIPRFNYDDLSVSSTEEHHGTDLQDDESRYLSSDCDFSNESESHDGGECSYSPDLQPPLRRSSRQRKSVDLCKRNLETPSFDPLQPGTKKRNLEPPPYDSVGVHPCSEGGKLRTIHYASRNVKDCSKVEESCESDEEPEYILDAILKRRINQTGVVPFYEYLIRWKPTWEPAEIETIKAEGEGEGAWKLQKILERRHLTGGGEQILCQWAPSWEPEDSLGDETLRLAQIRFRNGNDNEGNDDEKDDEEKDEDEEDDDNKDDDDIGNHDLHDDEKDSEEDASNSHNGKEYEETHNGQKHDNIISDNTNSDDDDDDEDDEVGEKYCFEGKIYSTYLEMVNAKRERNKDVLRRTLNELMEKCPDMKWCQ